MHRVSNSTYMAPKCSVSSAGIRYLHHLSPHDGHAPFTSRVNVKRGDAHMDISSDSRDASVPCLTTPIVDQPHNIILPPITTSPTTSSIGRLPSPMYRLACEDLCYHVEKGYLLILVNVNFRDMFFPRHGAEDDIKEAKNFFRKAGFDIEMDYVDKTKDEMDRILHERSQDPKLSQYDCFVLIVSSHGNEEGVLGSDSEPFPVQDIVDRFKPGACRLRIDVPRIFIVQACRGTLQDTGQVYYPRGPVRDGGNAVYEDLQGGFGLKRLPTDANALIAYATTEGKTAHSYVYPPYCSGQGQSGSWFMKCAMQIFSDRAATEDLLTMLTRVNRAMLAYGDNDGIKQVSSQVSQLTYKVYFTLVS